MLRTRSLVWVLATVVVVGLLGQFAMADDNQTKQPATPQAQNAQSKGDTTMGPEMMKQMMEKMGMTGQMPGSEMMAQCMNMMGQMGIPDEMMKRMDAMMKTPIFMDSPCAVYGQMDRLGLSDEQKEQLVTIENEAREKALAVLTPEQRETLGKLPNSPMAMMQMCQDMMGKMSADENRPEASDDKNK